MKVRPAALIIVNEAILTLRYNYNGTDVFMLPGGNMEFGENMQTCLARELEEELGIQSEIKDLLFIAEVHQAEMDKLHCVFNVVHSPNTQPRINPKETSALEIVYLPFEKIQEVALYPHLPEQILTYCQTRLIPSMPFLGEIQQPIY